MTYDMVHGTVGVKTFWSYRQGIRHGHRASGTLG
jgi:hypothetical protein